MEKPNLKGAFRTSFSVPQTSCTVDRRRRQKPQLPEGVPPFTHILYNDVPLRKHKKLKDDGIAVCECKYLASDPESACGERCLNVLTNTECVPKYCPCGDKCKNQRFQNLESAKIMLFQTEGRGWGILAEDNIKAGQFVIEYCGEVISLEVAKRRSHNYYKQGLKDSYIISLNANYFIDATKRGGLARFINHSCMPNCETRKWTVLGETRVGIFAKQDICAGTELSYNYNLEWYGGVTVRCLCGAANCSIFLGAKSRGFQEWNHVWEKGDDRYTAEDDEPFQTRELKFTNFKTEHKGSVNHLESICAVMARNRSHKADPYCNIGQSEASNEDPYCNIGQSQASNEDPYCNIGQSQASNERSPGNMENVTIHYFSRGTDEEVSRYEELEKKAISKLNEERERERDQQDTIPMGKPDRWISAYCAKLRADLRIRNNALRSKKPRSESTQSSGTDNKL